MGERGHPPSVPVGLDVGVRSAHRAQVVNENFEPVLHARLPAEPNSVDRFLHELASRKPMGYGPPWVCSGGVARTVFALVGPSPPLTCTEAMPPQGVEEAVGILTSCPT